MLEDSRSELKDFAILALGSTPSFESFKMLVDIRQSNAFDSFFRSNADLRLANYQAISRLIVLRKIMSMGGDENTVQYLTAATKELRSSVERSIGVSREPSDAGSDSSLPTHHTKIYQSFIKVLENIIGTKTIENDLLTHAEIALEKIKSIPSVDQIN
jgi:hypothetical protein